LLVKSRFHFTLVLISTDVQFLSIASWNMYLWCYCRLPASSAPETAKAKIQPRAPQPAEDSGLGKEKHL
jgi:hypothetical protein